jgi:hypothetical protein
VKVNRNKAMKKSGLKGSFPKMGGGSVQTGLSGRMSISSDTAMTDRVGGAQMPAAATTVPFKGKK